MNGCHTKWYVMTTCKGMFDEIFEEYNQLGNSFKPRTNWTACDPTGGLKLMKSNTKIYTLVNSIKNTSLHVKLI